MGAHELKALLNYNEIETRLTNIHYSFFFSSSKCVKIARSQNPIN